MAAADGRLADLADELNLELIVLFGSAVSDADPSDIDLAVLGPHDLDLPDLIARLIALTGCTAIDVSNLRRTSTLLASRALVGGELLWEDRPHRYAEASITAMTRHMDTEWLRRRQLDSLAG